MRPQKWLLREPGAEATARLFCIPYSGCGASMYRRWPRFIEHIETCPVQLPGRENRMREPAFATYEEMADGLVEGLAPFLDRPFAFFGHCGSALAAAETTARLAERGLPLPTRLFLSSQVAPHDPPYGRLLGMTHAQLREELYVLLADLGTPNPPEDLIDLVHEILVTDMEATRKYVLAEPKTLPTQITSLGWTLDIDVPAALTKGWAHYAPTTFELLDGVHYAFLDAPDALRRVIVRDLPNPAVS
ncbi:thioesterase [Actinospica durhamensis]|uniref:Thioesterase n=1 Tax=Actinospica durhamensis TaxID=1508375 RepID=A0A941EPT0_9ACTN|nr:thioesterase [Actinospica durhamensis]MBR7834893.1 thioesterase [Actinospica durhamensis]